MKNGYGMEKGSPAPQKAHMNMTEQKQEGQIAVDGFQQILEMLKIADPAFRESLLKRLAARDRELAVQLRQQLGI
jgi:hypothetical protein